jgi:lysophospholipase L1-like esterase
VRALGSAEHLVTDPIFVAAPAPHVPYHYKPGIRGRALDSTPVETNALGFRDLDRPAAPPNGAIRIVVLGDSFTFGQGVAFDEVYTQILERELSGEFAPRRVEVINFGVQGFTVEDAVGVYLDIARHLDPDVALLAIVADDLNLARKENFVDARGYLTKRVGGESAWKAYLRASHLVLLAKEAYLKLVYRRSRGFADQAVTEASLQGRLAYLDTALDSLLAACARQEVVPVFALLDTWRSGVLAPLIDHVRTRYPALLTVDCSDSLAAHPFADIVHPKSGHPSALGHRVIAAQLGVALRPLLRSRPAATTPSPSSGRGR